jgi:hypothetical protein
MCLANIQKAVEVATSVVNVSWLVDMYSEVCIFTEAVQAASFSWCSGVLVHIL